MTATQSITLEKIKTRLYFAGDSYSVKDQIKALGGHWDGDRRQWWVGSAKASEAEALVAKLSGAASGSTADTAPAKEDADSIKLVGKAKYKGRTYYVRWVGQCKDGSYKCRLVTLDQSLDFWAACARPHEQHIDGNGDVAAIVKTYQPREVRYGYRGKSRTEYTTLGSIKRFIDDQKNPATSRGECTECGSWGPSGEPCKDCGGEGHHV
jgi:hypothetical protein